MIFGDFFVKSLFLYKKEKIEKKIRMFA